MPYKNPEDRREQARKWRAANPGYQKQKYAEHRAKRLAAKREAYHSDPEKLRERGRKQYEKDAAKRVAYAREYRIKNKEDVNKRARERYYNNLEEINARRKIYRKKHYVKIYERIQKWRRENPEREFLYHAKRLLSEQTGIAYRDIPDDIAEAKVEQLRIHRMIKGLEEELPQTAIIQAAEDGG